MRSGWYLDPRWRDFDPETAPFLRILATLEASRCLDIPNYGEVLSRTHG